MVSSVNVHAWVLPTQSPLIKPNLPDWVALSSSQANDAGDDNNAALARDVTHNSDQAFVTGSVSVTSLKHLEPTYPPPPLDPPPPSTSLGDADLESVVSAIGDDGGLRGMTSGGNGSIGVAAGMLL